MTCVQHVVHGHVIYGSVTSQPIPCLLDDQYLFIEMYHETNLYYTGMITDVQP